MNKQSFFIIGQHAVMEALKNPARKVLRVFLTEESKKNIHRKSPNKNLLDNVKVYFKTKKELDKYSTKENLLHQGYVAEVEQLEKPILKDAALLITDPIFLGSVTPSKQTRVILFFVFMYSFKVGFSSCSTSAT